MDSYTVDQLERYSGQLAEAVKSLRSSMAVAEADFSGSSETPPLETAKAKASILANVEGIRTLLDEPNEFLQRLALQVEVLACLKWLAEFQILVCIPLELSLPMGDLADLAGVPERQLRRIIRLTASVGFLQETKPNYVSHTPISAEFLASPSLSDAALFITSTYTPSALQMADTTKAVTTGTHGDIGHDVALHRMSQRSFRAARQDQERCKLGRQWKAYLDHAAGSPSSTELVDTFSRLNWSSLGSACIVEVGAQSTLMAQGLAQAFPNLYFLVQLDTTSNSTANAPTRDTSKEGAYVDHHHHRRRPSASSVSPSDSTRIKVAFRDTGMPQPVSGAAVYILHLPSASELARAELFRHLAPLRANSSIVLVLTTRILPEPGSLPDPRVEAVARARDLALLQLADEEEMEMAELRQIVDSVTDEFGRLVVANELRSHNGLILALALKHKQHGY